MSKSAAYSALGQGLMFGAQQWQQSRADTAAARREEALAELRHRYNTAEQDRGFALKRELGDIEFQREQRASEMEMEREAPRREAELESERALSEQRRASAEAARARASTYGEEGGGQNLTANQRDALALAKAKDIPEGQAWDIIVQSGRQPPEQAISRIASSLIGTADVLNPKYADDPRQAYADATEIYNELRKADQQDDGRGGTRGPAGDLSGGQGGPGGGLMDQAGGNQKPPIDAAASEARNALNAGADPIAVEQRLRETGYSEQEIQQVMGSL